MKHVLILAAIYPPMNRVSARRPSGFAKYLPDHGWIPHVITRDFSWSRSFDQDYHDDRVESAVFARVKGGSDEVGQGGLQQHVQSYLQGKRFPVEWTNGAVSAAESLLAAQKIDVILATYPTASVFYIARKLSRKYGIPWVADFRDLAGQVAPEHALQRLTIARHIMWEKQLARAASAHSSAQWGPILEWTKKRYGKVEHIPNSFDPDIFFGTNDRPRDKFQLVFTGSLNPGFNLDVLGKAMDELIAEGAIDPELVELRFLGTKEASLRASFTTDRVWRTVNIIDWQPAAEVARAQREALILVHASNPNSSGWMTGKIMEYLGARRPILTIPGDRGGVNQLLDQTGAGVACPTVADARKQIVEWYREWQQTGDVKYPGIEEEVMKFSYPYQSGRMANLLNRVVSR